jgi:3-hydroxyisobutyrate dehydrogenase-like beta-hydroxyacid dehydrogenase
MHVGFIGLGSQGGPMARRIVEGGYPTTLWARRQATLEPFADTPAKVAGSPAELAAACEMVCLCVVGDADVYEIVCGENGVLDSMKPASVIAVHSTVHPDTCRELAKKAAAKGVRSSTRP